MTIQDKVIENVQNLILNFFDDSLSENQISQLNQELEVTILSAFYENGYFSTSKLKQ